MTWLKSFWDSMDVVKLLAIMLTVSYVAMLLFGVAPDETLRNVFLMIAAYYFGSSLGSKTKDAALLPPPPDKKEI